MFFNPSPVTGIFEIDACMEGLGGRFKNQVYYISMAGNMDNYNICHLEMLNVLVSLRIWGKEFKNKKITIKCDNMSAVLVLTNGKTGDAILAAIARNIQMQAAMDNVTLKVIHVQGKQNTAADILSTWGLQPDVEKLNKIIPTPHWITVPSCYVNIDWNI